MTATATPSARNAVVLDRDRVPPAGATGEILQVPLELIDVDENVRRDVASLEELAASIAEHGVRQPISVRDTDGDRFAINFGQRRFLASKIAGKATIPAFVDNEARNAEQLAIHQLVENLAREDLPPLDRARAMRTVVDAGMSQAELARQLGIGASTVTNDLGLLDAPEEVQQLVADGSLTPAHAKAMKGLAPASQVEVARYVVQHRLSAHATEEEVQRLKKQAEQEKERRSQDAKESAARREQIVASIATFPAKKVGKGDPIVVSVDHMQAAQAGHLVELIKKAGYENVRVAKQWGEVQTRPAGLCDCTTWKASEHTTYGRYDYKTGLTTGSKYSVSITKGCIVRKHQQAKEAAAEAKRREKEQLAERVQQHVRKTAFAVAIPPTSADTPLLIGIPRILAEAILWDVLSYNLPWWSEAHGGKPNAPWTPLHALSDAELAKELAIKVASDFRDKAGYHVDWPALAEELLPKAEPA